MFVFVGRSVCHDCLKGREVPYHAPIESLVYKLLSILCSLPPPGYRFMVVLILKTIEKKVKKLVFDLRKQTSFSVNIVFRTVLINPFGPVRL